ncbi:DoxX family protein [uncultured Deinococcus sp.]|uniref:DoxX family protein n=1 Tax=uncultured Deinococcus sp. TaxID=158789 RepID=UPI00258CDD61|nr:DoxX family protein [uncultured Deinococcus sp.]
MTTPIRTAPATSAPSQADLGLLLLRLATGVIFVMHGYQKFFLNTVAGTAQFFAGIGVPLPGVAAPLIAGIELIGGLLLILGLFPRVVGALLAVNMLVAILLVHVSGGFFNPNGVEFPLLLLAASATLALTGAGRYRLGKSA